MPRTNHLDNGTLIVAHRNFNPEFIIASQDGSFANSVLDCQLHHVVTPASNHRLLESRVTMKLPALKKANRVPSLDYACLTNVQTAKLVGSDICTAIGHTPYYTQLVATGTTCKNHLPVKPHFARSRPWLDSDIIAAQKRVLEANKHLKKQELVTQESRQLMQLDPWFSYTKTKRKLFMQAWRMR